MSRQETRWEDRVADSDAYAELHLLPSAPGELVVEVYWHLAHRLQAAAGEEAAGRRSLDRLNGAYARIAGASAGASAEPGYPAGIASGGRPEPSERRRTLRRLWRRPQPPTAQRHDPWEVLHLQRDAPPEVIDLAYGVLRSRLRNQWGDAAAAALEDVQHAYRALQNGPPQSSPVGDAAASEADSGPDHAPPHEGDAGTPRSSGRASQGERRSALRDVQRAGGALLLGLAKATGATIRFVHGRVRRAASGRAERVVHRPGVDATDRGGAVPPEAAHEPGQLSAPEDSPEPILPIAESFAGTPAPLSATVAPEPEPPGASPTQERGSSEATSERQVLSGAAPVSIRVNGGRAGSPLAWLCGESDLLRGANAAIGHQPFTIGAAPTSDIVISAQDGQGDMVLARIWFQEDRFVFHGLGGAPEVRVNGQSLTWAVLEDGDTLEIGGNVFSFRRQLPSE